jgi:centromeric protein E|eukprot:SAG25_NODE_182_length_12512_cov_80.886732_1_plen_179_part_00
MADQKAIVVAVRCRPMSLAERINDNEQAVVPTTNPRVIKIVGDGKDNDYTVDHTFWEEDTNEHVYGTVGKNTLDSAFAGYNGTIFAYGQTGSGKTHTMMGGDGENAGIIPRLCKDLFARIEAESIKAEVRCSYVEIYGQSEKLSDLLLPEGTTVAPTLAVRQRKSTGAQSRRPPPQAG